jgi:hypothetical protein
LRFVFETSEQIEINLLE